MEKPGGSKSTSHTTSHRYIPSNIRDQQQENIGKVTGGLPAPLGGFQLKFVIISRVINHMTFYNLNALIG